MARIQEEEEVQEFAEIYLTFKCLSFILIGRTSLGGVNGGKGGGYLNKNTSIHWIIILKRNGTTNNVTNIFV